MTWFKYLKDTENINPITRNTSYSYPLCKRSLKKITPKDTLSVGTWLFVDISEININKYYDDQINIQEDETSYIVVYESLSSQVQYTPVESVIVDNILFFKTAEQHNASEEISKQYSIYYNSKNIRKINSVNNGGQTDYQINLLDSPYYSDQSDVDLTTIDVYPDSSYYYSFSYLNGWDNGTATAVGAKLYATFTGPNFYLYGNIGKNFGKFRYKLIGLINKKYMNSSEEISWTTVDCYSSENKYNQLLLQLSNLKYRDYQLYIEVINDKNILSTGNNINISSYSFTYNTYNIYEDELINPDTVFVSSGNIK